MAAVGLAFKTSIAPFHQWTPDVYQGAPTPITSFMAVATKAAAFAVFVRFFDVALAPEASDWQPALAVLAAISIVIGNVGALGQELAEAAARLLRRRPGGLHPRRPGRRQRGRGQRARLLPRRLRVHEPRRLRGDRRARARDGLRRRHPRRARGSARERPLLAWPLTISMLGLAGLPATAGFIGKLYLIEALVEGDYTWLAVFIAVGTMISLAYYLRVVAAMWMRPGGEAAPAPRRRSPAPRRRPTRSTPRPAAAPTSSRPPCSPPPR